MVAWINDHKEWLFSGVGVVAVSVVIKFARHYWSSRHGGSKKRWACTRLLPNFLLRRFCRLDILKQLIEIDLRPRWHPVELDFGGLPKAKIWLQIINHSSFDVELTSISVELWVHATTIELMSAQVVDVEAHSTNSNVLIKGVITDEQAEHCACRDKQGYTAIRIAAKAKFRFSELSIDTKQLEDPHIHIINSR